MSLSSEKRTIASLAVAFGLVAMATLLSMMGFGQFHGDRWVEARQSSVRELQEIGRALSIVLVNSQRYIVSGERNHLEGYYVARDDLKKHLYNLQSLEGGGYGQSERVRRLANEIGLELSELDLDVQMRNDNKSTPVKNLMLTTRELRDAEQIFKRISTMQHEESATVQAFFSGDVKARGNSLPIIAFIFSCLSFVFAMVEYFGGRSEMEEEERRIELEGNAVRAYIEGNVEPVGLGSNGNSNGNGSSNGNGREIGPEDISHLRRDLASAMSQLEKLANTDYLTDMLNVRGLEQVLKIEDNRANRSGGPLIAMLVNCDNLKKVNEGLGHATGDIILKESAKRIQSALRPTDHVARVGGDEFLVLLPDTNLPYGLRVAERIRAGISDAPMHNKDDILHMTASIGVAALPPKIASVQEAVSLARAALKRSKEAGKNKVTYSEDAKGPPGRKRGKVDEGANIVEQLLDVSSFRTVYQPIINLSNDTVEGYEVLSRGPGGAFESPADFFRICVENNMLTAVDLQCLRLCIEESSEAIGANLRLHVNLFPSTLLETPVENLLEIFPKDGLLTQFCVEISEQEFISEPAYLREHVNALKAAGIMVAIDDVGFGRSSLETLILLEPDLVKVDRKYVAGLSSEPAKARLLRRLANVAKSLGAQIIAEGIEDRNDLPILRDMGIDYGQGFLWGELLPTLPANLVKKG